MLMFLLISSYIYLYSADDCLKIIGDGILKKISYVLKSVLSLKVCKLSIQTNQHRIQNRSPLNITSFRLVNKVT